MSRAVRDGAVLYSLTSFLMLLLNYLDLVLVSDRVNFLPSSWYSAVPWI